MVDPDHTKAANPVRLLSPLFSRLAYWSLSLAPLDDDDRPKVQDCAAFRALTYPETVNNL